MTDRTSNPKIPELPAELRRAAKISTSGYWAGVLLEAADEIEAARRGHETSEESRSFQDRVFDWARDCFGEHDTTSRELRTDRFLEEALELAQACGCPAERASRVLAYVYGRPAGEVAQETGGTMVSLAVLCQAFGIGMSRCAEAELTRVLGKIEHIRARHAAKPDFSVKSEAPREPLPIRKDAQ